VTGQELCADARITYRQLDYWTRTGLLQPVVVTPGSGRARGYDLDQAERAAAIRELLYAGVSLQIIRAHIDDFVTTGVLEVGPITITRTPPEAS
jgi:DNA-binding transcriptional MerR regulator